MNARDGYLVDALVLLAATHPEALTVAEIARRRGIPAPFLGRLLADAARRGVVATLRGPRGGVRLAEPPAAIPLSAILDLGPSEPTGGRAVRWLDDELRGARLRLLERLTLEHLLEHERAAAAVPDWTI